MPPTVPPPEYRCIYEDDIKEMRNDIRAIRDTLLGNGKVGLMTRVALIESKFMGIAWIIGPAITAVVTAGLMWVIFRKVP